MIEWIVPKDELVTAVRLEIGNELEEYFQDSPPPDDLAPGLLEHMMILLARISVLTAMSKYIANPKARWSPKELTPMVDFVMDELYPNGVPLPHMKEPNSEHS